jgi:hypothetical protein
LLKDYEFLLESVHGRYAASQRAAADHVVVFTIP